MRARVVVIGAGVIGAGCAYYLNRAGWDVTVIDRGKFGSGCSHANCGLVVPSHVLPLAAPGAIGSTAAALFRKNSAFSIKPRLDPALWSWLIRFARRCNERDMLEAGRAIQALLDSSRSLYDELFHSEAPDAEIEAEWTQRGLLFAFQTRSAMDHYAGTDRLLRDSFGVGATRYDSEALIRLEPALKPGLAGGWHYQTDAHLRPDRFLASLQRLLESRGVTIREHCELRGFEKNTGEKKLKRIETSTGMLDADAFVIAAGAWTPRLNVNLGCRIPIQPGKGYSMTMPRPARSPNIPLLFEEHRVAVTPMQSGYRLGSIMEFAGYDASLDPRRLELLRTGASHYLIEPTAEPIVERWFGWRPMTYDSIPIIGRSPALQNVLIATGHNMLGLSMAPATGKLVTELLGDEPTHIDATPYSPSRF
jgi:D-amino-acid dehydrogenase